MRSIKVFIYYRYDKIDYRKINYIIINNFLSIVKSSVAERAMV